MDNDSSSNNDNKEERDQMDLLYLLLPIIGAFLMLFAVCCCGKKVKEILHMPKELAIGGRPSREMELLARRSTPQHQQQPPIPRPSTSSDTRQRCASGESHSQIECVPTSEDAMDHAIAVQVDTSAMQMSMLIHPLQAPCCSHKRYIGDVTEQELETLLLGQNVSPERLRHDSGIANCSCHRSLMSVEVPSDAIVIEEEEEDDQAQMRQDADEITVIDQVEEDPERPRAMPETLPLGPWAHLHPYGRTRRKSGNSVGRNRLHRSLCEGLHRADIASPCPCSATSQHAFRYTVSFDCDDEHHRTGSEVISEDSRRRHLSVGSCDTAESDIIVHVASDDAHVASDDVHIDHENVRSDVHAVHDHVPIINDNQDNNLTRK